MRNRCVASVAAVALLAGAGGGYTYTQYAESATVTPTVAAAAPLDPVARDLGAHKTTASAKRQAKHATATAARKAREAAARRATQSPSNLGQPCNGDPSQYQVLQADGSCSGPVHYGGAKYYDNHSKPCPGDAPCAKAPGYPDDNTSNDPLIQKCPSGAATSPEWNQLIKHGQPNMQPPKCGDGSTPAYLRTHGVKC